MRTPSDTIIGPLKPRDSTRIYRLDHVAAILRTSWRNIGSAPGIYDVARPTSRGGFAWTWRDIVAFVRMYESIRAGRRIREGTHFLMPREAAQYLGVTEGALRRWQDSFDGPRVFRLPRNQSRYAVTDIDDWLASQTAIEDEETKQERISKLIASGKPESPRVLNRRFLPASIAAGRNLGKPSSPLARRDSTQPDSAEIGDSLDFAD